MKKGDRIYFGRRRGEQTLGEIVKVNPKGYRVRQLETRGTTAAHGAGTMWTVPHRMARPAEDVVTPRPALVRAPPARSSSRQRGRVRVINGVNIDVAVSEFRKLPVFREYPLPTPLRVDVAHYAYQPKRYRGTAFYRSGRIRIMGGAETPPARTLEVVLHELVHLATPDHHHDALFRKVFARAVREAWIVEIPIDLKSAHRGHLRAYAMGDYLVGKLFDRPPRTLYGYSATGAKPKSVRAPAPLAALKPKPKPKSKRKPKRVPAKKSKRPRKPGGIITADELLAEALGKLK